MDESAEGVAYDVSCAIAELAVSGFAVAVELGAPAFYALTFKSFALSAASEKF